MLQSHARPPALGCSSCVCGSGHRGLLADAQCELKSRLSQWQRALLIGKEAALQQAIVKLFLNGASRRKIERARSASETTFEAKFKANAK